jgi:SAM-dependent methyltransferase
VNGPDPGHPGSAAVNREYYEQAQAGRQDYWKRMAAPIHRRRVLLGELAAGGHGSAVDLGCGNGQLLAEISRYLPHLALAGIDLSARQIADNRAATPAIEWYEMDLDRELPETAPAIGPFDAVIASEVIEHVANPLTFLVNARRLARPDGGTLYLTTQSGPLRETERRVGHHRHFSAREMQELLVRAGWQPQRVWNTGFPFHTLSKILANLDPDRTMRRFSERQYGLGERLLCWLLRCAFVCNSRRHGPQLFAIARAQPAAQQTSPEADWEKAPDYWTAKAFSESWNRAASGSVYTHEQFVDWFAPYDLSRITGKDVLELGFGNGSMLYHMARYRPRRLCGVELGDTISETRKNLAHLQGISIELHQGDLTVVDLGPFDLVYCIGVLHHLEDPEKGFQSVIRHTRPGGDFHCWVYAREGNGLVIALVDPIRRVASRLPWWFTKYCLAAPLMVPFFAYAKLLRALRRSGLLPSNVASRLPLGAYALWIAARRWPFFHHVAFDQLVTPRTVYVPRATVDAWLAHPEIEPGSTYVVFRNGNSWELGGRRRG